MAKKIRNEKILTQCTLFAVADPTKAKTLKSKNVVMGVNNFSETDLLIMLIFSLCVR